MRLSFRRSGSIPASSRACQLTSSIMRCCGSSSSASTGEIRKKASSNWSISSTKAPKRQPSLRTGPSPKIWPQRPVPAPGSPSTTAFPPVSRRRQKASMSFAPGNRHAMPMIAIGSPDADGSELEAESALEGDMSRFLRFPRSGCRNFVDVIDASDPDVGTPYKDSCTALEGQHRATTTKAPPEPVRRRLPQRFLLSPARWPLAGTDTITRLTAIACPCQAEQGTWTRQLITSFS